MHALLKFAASVSDAFADAALGCAVHLGALVGEVDTAARAYRDAALEQLR